uniref:Uncharacterized protein n=1 Tax=viral metagenome TaxID=1070528 RepID=A0A6C0C8U3_9ZZZZ
MDAHKYYTFLIVCCDNAVPLNQNGIIGGVIYVEKGWPCEDLSFEMCANKGVRFIELVPNGYHKVSEQIVAKKYSVYVGSSRHDDVIRINFRLSLSKCDNSLSQFAEGYDKQHGCFDVIHDLFSVEMSYKTNNGARTISECLSICRQVTLIDTVKYSLETVVRYLSKQQYIYAQCEMIDIIQKIKAFDVTKSKNLLFDLESYHDLLVSATIETLTCKADKIISNLLECEQKN